MIAASLIRAVAGKLILTLWPAKAGSEVSASEASAHVLMRVRVGPPAHVGDGTVLHLDLPAAQDVFAAGVVEARADGCGCGQAGGPRASGKARS